MMDWPHDPTTGAVEGRGWSLRSMLRNGPLRGETGRQRARALRAVRNAAAQNLAEVLPLQLPARRQTRGLYSAELPLVMTR